MAKKTLVAVPFAAGVVVAIVAARAIRIGKRPLVDIILERTQGTGVPENPFLALQRGVTDVGNRFLDLFQVPRTNSSSAHPGQVQQDPNAEDAAAAGGVDLGVLPVTA